MVVFFLKSLFIFVRYESWYCFVLFGLLIKVKEKLERYVERILWFCVVFEISCIFRGVGRFEIWFLLMVSCVFLVLGFVVLS